MKIAKFLATLAVDELKSPVRLVNYVPPACAYREISPGHLVQVE